MNGDNLPACPFLVALHVEIAELRREHHVTQFDIADALFVSQPYVHDRVSGKRPWTTDDLALMAPLFGGIDAFELIARARVRSDGHIISVEVSGITEGRLERLPRMPVKRQRPIK